MNLVSLTVSLTTLDPELKRTLEPRTASPQGRLRVISAVARAGIPVSVLLAPLIPAVNDAELEQLLAAAAAAGATRAGYVLLRLPYEVKDLFRAWLEEHLPLRAAHVMSLVQQARGVGTTIRISGRACAVPVPGRRCCARASSWPASGRD